MQAGKILKKKTTTNKQKSGNFQPNQDRDGTN